jgi:hypothetical protein
MPPPIVGPIESLEQRAPKQRRVKPKTGVVKTVGRRELRPEPLPIVGAGKNGQKALHSPAAPSHDAPAIGGHDELGVRRLALRTGR